MTGATSGDAQVPRWRVGQHYGIHVYEDADGTDQGDRPVATFQRAEDAARAVEAVNAAIPIPADAMTRAVIEGLRETVYGLLGEQQIRWYDQAGMERLARSALMVTEREQARAVAEVRRDARRAALEEAARLADDRAALFQHSSDVSGDAVLQDFAFDLRRLAADTDGDAR